jgi:energy-coupling factor transporter ATP-binding protein EcfA2
LTASSKLWLRSLTIHRYEQFRDCERVEFSPDDNLILGVNGSGKTSLLRLLAAVLRWNYDALLGHPFDIEFEQVLEVDGAETVSIDGRVKNQSALHGGELSLRSHRGARSKYDQVEAKFTIEHPKWMCTADVSDSMLQVMDGINDFGRLPLQTPWVALEIASSLIGNSANYLKDDHPGFVAERIHDHNVATFVVRETEGDFAQLTERILYDYSVGADSPVDFAPEDDVENRQWYPLLYEVVTRAVERRNDHPYLAPVAYERGAGADRYFDMSSLLAALGAEIVDFRPKIQKTESLRKGEFVEAKGVEIRVRFPSGTEVIDSRLTFGQKRLITIGLGALICGGSPLLVDEIDNGLHPGLVEKTLELIRGRQTFIASHNKLVVDLLDYESPEDMRRTIHVCRREADGTQRLVELTDDQVREVFEKIEVGIMDPSDVLLREGLW